MNFVRPANWKQCVKVWLAFVAIDMQNVASCDESNSDFDTSVDCDGDDDGDGIQLVQLFATNAVVVVAFDWHNAMMDN